MPHLVHVATVPQSLMFVGGQVDHAVANGWKVSVVTSGGTHLDAFARAHDVQAFSVQMSRAITPRADAECVATVTDLLLELDPDVVHGHTPKGGLVSMLAATAAGVPARVYHMRGLLTLTASGPRRALLAAAERTSCRLAHRVVCQSNSLREIAAKQRLVPRSRSLVFGKGGNGVDAQGRFNPENVTGLSVRSQLGIPESAPVVGFVGRLVRDKGIVELVEAWRTLRSSHPDLRMIIVGPFEERDAVPEDTVRVLREDPRIHLVGYARDTPRYYEAMDMLVLPSYREGFPNVPLEAAAMTIPTITTDAIGCIDAVEDGVTGTIVGVGDARALGHAIDAYVTNPLVRREHGAAARRRVLREFQPRDRHEATLRLYSELLDGAR